LRLLKISPHAVDACIGRHQAHLGIGVQLSDMAKDAGTKDPEAKW
jgi:hypothetical protein